MKKTLVAKLALAGSVGLVAALASGSANAAPCSACHTMHNSQNGIPMRFDSGDTPLAKLLRDDCLGCHTGINSGTSVVTAPPRVIGSSEPTYGNGNGQTLAGGDFYWSITIDSMGHNVSGVSPEDTDLASVAPGGPAAGLAQQLECAGVYGCHGWSTAGNEDPLTSLDGAHHFAHNNFDVMAATEPGDSYRYLVGVKGLEDTDWEYTAADAGVNHNVYAGTIRTTDGQTAANDASLNTLCARCHPSFHNRTDAGSDTYGITEAAGAFTGNNWIRHPTDYDMSTTATTEFAAYNTYSVEAPVGVSLSIIDTYVNVGNSSVAANHRVVMCVSCHRAHGSPYPDMLRWDYTAMLVGTSVTTGCMECHTEK